MKRTIIIGDVHGCMAELEELLGKTEATEKDDIILIGDFVRKGPDSASVLRWAMETPNVRCILGNHEVKLLNAWFGGEEPDRDDTDWAMWRQLEGSYNEAMDFIRSLPLYIEENGFLAVHAGIDPRIHSIRRQSAHDLLTIRIPEGMDVPWYEAYTGESLIVFGHWARRDPVVRTNAIGIDTGCIYGGSLTALILPERRLISVPAAQEHQKHQGWK
jgi:serine/threonine protein phosphatase 1